MRKYSRTLQAPPERALAKGCRCHRQRREQPAVAELALHDVTRVGAILDERELRLSLLVQAAASIAPKSFELFMGAEARAEVCAPSFRLLESYCGPQY